MIAREGIPFILIGLAASLVFLWGATRYDSKWMFAAALVFGIVALFTVFFFRDPDRTFTMANEIIVSPADGKVVGIEQESEHPFMGGAYTRISIFLSVFDVHVNRVPANGTIDYVKYNPGKFLAAFEPKASSLNEQTEIGMTTAGGNKVIFKQIAGLIARRIVCKLKQGDSVTVGERFGLIRFGSRTDLFLPSGNELKIKVGDRVTGGKTVIAYLSPATAPQSTSSVEPTSERL